MSLTLSVLLLYFGLVLGVGLWVGRKKSETAEDYFLAGRKLPWYAVGLSMVGSNISTEHFLGMVGAAYLVGIAPANWEWMSMVSLSLLIGLFMPYYFRSKIITVPQFLEKRYAPHTRTLFALLSIVHLVVVLLAGALYAGGLIIHDYFQPTESALLADGGISPVFLFGIVLVAVVTGAYSIKGGLTSVVWTDVVQVVILVAGGATVAVLALNEAGGWSQMMEANRQAGEARTHLLRPASDDFAPWTGVFTLWMSLGIWYACTNQFYIQRCFGARTEWDARMGIVLTGVLKMCLPLLVVFPGMMAFAIYGEGLEADKVYTTLVRDFLPTGLDAVVLAAMAAAIMSTVSSVLNSASTIFTIDLYQRYLNPGASQDKLVRIGRWSTLAILLFATVWAPFILFFGDGLFVYIQEMATFFAPPIGVIFVVGMLSKKATPSAATWTLIGGTVFGILLKIVSLHVGESTQAWLAPFLNRAFFTFLFSLLLIALISRFTRAAATEQTTITWNWSYARLPEAERKRFTGLRNFYLWWGLWVGCVIVLFITFH